VPAVTIHSTPEFAAAHLDDDPDEWVAALLTAARPHHRGEIVHAAGHRWRYAQPRNTFEFGAVALDAAPRVILAGEAFSGARVEGAFTSGVAAAQLVHVLLG
jgi:predicted NAD/FAD-dependent oxidoreductase